MDDHSRASRSVTPWIRTALLFGFVYLLVGRVSTLPADNVGMWRLAAWAISAVAFAAHFWYEHFRLRNPYRTAAFHIAFAVAVGAFGLAVAAMTRSLWKTGSVRPVWLLALILWPAITAVPGFLVALACGAILTIVRRNEPA
jgi:hypothetical protein